MSPKHSLSPSVRNGSLPQPAQQRTKQAHVDSRTLFAGGSEVVIVHYGEEYQLRQTRLGKLILTK